MSKYMWDFDAVNDEFNEYIKQYRKSKDNEHLNILFIRLRDFSKYVMNISYKWVANYEDIASDFASYIIERVCLGNFPDKIYSWYMYVKASIMFMFPKHSHISLSGMPIDEIGDLYEQPLPVFDGDIFDFINKVRFTAIFPLILCKIKFPEIRLTEIETEFIKINIELLNFYTSEDLSKLADVVSKSSNPTEEFICALERLASDGKMHPAFPYLARLNMEAFIDLIKVIEGKVGIPDIADIEAMLKKVLSNNKVGNDKVCYVMPTIVNSL